MYATSVQPKEKIAMEHVDAGSKLEEEHDEEQESEYDTSLKVNCLRM